MGEQNARNEGTAYDAAQAAKSIGVVKQTLANWRFLGKGPAYCKFGRRVVYFEDDLRRFIEQNKVIPE